ncbi:glycerol-3-phosphate dehydrogenase [NAD(P)+] [Endomicrobiia bacterium]|nr:glycerol-3-phosphate dehydrogenase [NAD(P)+] [Endomicrobiia bacterium]GHT14008.1 glycerol-3-phosphate dehydrogenase [NAD(P)+] [Endomicrobiia bacterium]GHT19252.1 glycerol-3-phosphate dehydrogenase [NAD(P)+] [Endomicrobiia bacterium]GHT26845.1 glycerol-3-phosphate dehydrogenase [NAD(P)+] [Endomicrobiia bacterium]GHT31322.1 glycerol-3-phosphate dehydrogenase [NAD(P)+] [Endomicrobiia bacterium]
MKITVLGAGSWGATLAALLFENGHDVTLWEFDAKRAKDLQDRKIKPFNAGTNLPSALVVTNSIKSLKNSEAVLFVIPSQYMRSLCLHLKNNGILLDGKLIISATKGIENKTLLRMSEVIDEIFKGVYRNIAVLSGPSHAEEVCRKIPTAVTSTALNLETAERCRMIFMNEYFRIYNQNDIIGVETGSALKNVFAVASGIVDGLKYGDNTKAAIISRGLKELSRVGIALGGKEQTFYGLSGVGDLMVTCFSKHSRNRAIGQAIGEGKTLDEAEKNLGMVAEGVKNTISAYEIGKKLNIELPIINEVYAILFEGKNPLKAVSDLMTRCPCHE